MLGHQLCQCFLRMVPDKESSVRLQPEQTFDPLGLPLACRDMQPNGRIVVGVHLFKIFSICTCPC
jgi:hypothetical protein